MSRPCRGSDRSNRRSSGQDSRNPHAGTRRPAAYPSFRSCRRSSQAAAWGRPASAGGSLRCMSRRQRQDVERRQVAELVLPACEHDHRPGIVQHVGDQRVRQGRVEEHQGPAGLEDREMRRDDLPVVLRHRHGHDLVGAGEERSNGRGHVLRPSHRARRRSATPRCAESVER